MPYNDNDQSQNAITGPQCRLLTAQEKKTFYDDKHKTCSIFFCILFCFLCHSWWIKMFLRLSQQCWFIFSTNTNDITEAILNKIKTANPILSTVRYLLVYNPFVIFTSLLSDEINNLIRPAVSTEVAGLISPFPMATCCTGECKNQSVQPFILLSSLAPASASFFPTLPFCPVLHFNDLEALWAPAQRLANLFRCILIKWNHRSRYKYADTGLPSVSVTKFESVKLTSHAQHASRWRMRASQTCRLLCLCCQLASRACATVRIGETASLC